MKNNSTSKYTHYNKGTRFLFLLSLLVLFNATELLAQTFYSRASGNWNNTNTWSTVGCGGAAAASLPTATSDIVICSGNTVTANVAVTCRNITVNNTGRLQITNSNFTVTQTTTVDTGGTIDDNNQTGDDTYNTIINNGTFTASIAGTYSTFFNGNITNNGTFSLSGSNQYTFGSNLTITNNGGNMLFTLGFSSGLCSINAGSTVTIANGTSTGFVALYGNTINLNGAIINNYNNGQLRLGRFDGTGTLTNSGYIYYEATNTAPSATLINNVGSTFDYAYDSEVKPVTYHHLIFSYPSGFPCSLIGNITVNGNLSLTNSSAILNANTHTINLKGNWSNLGTFNANTGTVSFTGTTNQTISGNTTFNNLTINNSSDVTINSGNNAASNNLTLTNGKVILNNAANLSFNTITGASSTNYIVTNGTGSLRKINSATNVTFPIGSSTDYQPLRLSNAAANSSVRFGTGLSVPAGGVGSWFVNNATTSSTVALLNPQGGTLSATSRVNVNSAGWNPLTTTYAAPNYTTSSSFAFSATHEFSVFTTPPPTVNLSVSSTTGSEAATSVITVTATASQAVVGNQTVNLAVTGTGITAGDYNLSNTTITILNGQTTGSVTFTVVDDVLVEGTETATLTISSPSAGITLGTPTSRTITITDNDNLPEINVQGNGNNIVSGTVTTSLTNDTNFGSILECNANTIVKMFTIQNTGGVVLNISGITVTGGNFGDFTVSSIPTTVAAGGSETFTITFNPSATGNRATTVSIANNDSDENPYTFAINGNGTADVTNPTITAPTNVTVNTDAGLCTASGVALGTPTGSDNCGTPTFTNDAIPPFAIGTTTVTWTATDASGNTATATQTVTVTGAREINVLGNAVSIVDGDVTPSLADDTDFGNVATSRVVTYTIQNTGTEVIAISSIVSSGANASDFVVSSVPTSVAAGGTATFNVTFTPSVTGTRNATITINNNDCNESAYDFAVQGTQPATPEINVVSGGITITDGDLTPSLLDNTDFGNIASIASVVISIQNQSATTPLTINSIILSGANAADFSISGITTPTSIAVTSRTSFILTFNRATLGTSNAVLTINNNDANEGVYDFAIQATKVSDNTNPTITCPATYTAVQTLADCKQVIQYAYPYGSDNLPYKKPIAGFEFLGSTNGKSYYRSTTQANYATAIANCYAAGGYLLHIDNATENNFIRDLIVEQISASSWLGFDDRRLEGTFEWENGQPSAYTNWRVSPAEPNNAGGIEDVASFQPDGFWNDVPETILNGYIMEISGGLVVQTAGLPSGSTFPIGTTTNTFEITDAAGNTSTCSFDVVVGEEVNVLGNAVSIADGDITPSLTDNTDFGNVATSRVITYTIQNTGTTALTISSIVSSGTHASDFVVSSIPTSVAAGGSATFDVTFTPSATGTRNATITINNNNCNRAVYDFAVQGTQSAAPEINLQGNGNNIVSGTGTTSVANDTNFGSILECGTNNNPNTFTIQNTGTGALSVTNITVTGTNAADFTLSGLPTFPATVAVSGTQTFTVTFNPSATGNRTALVTITNNDTDEGTYTFAINGNGLADATNPTITAPTNVTVNTDAGLCTASGVALGTPTGSDNCGTPTFTNDATPPFAIGTTTVTWTATDASGNTATATQTVTVTGTREINILGNAVSIVDGDVTPNVADNTDFGNTTSRTITYTIENTGTEVIAISSIVSSGTNAADFVVSSVPTSVSAGGTATFDVTFTPSSTGVRTATITINNDDCNESAYDFAVQGSNISSGDVLLVRTGIFYPTIQAAVDAAIANDVIKPMPTTVPKNYNENVIVNKTLTFTSDFTDYKNVNINQIRVTNGNKLTITGNMSIVQILHLEATGEVEVTGSTTDFALLSTATETALIINDSPTNTVVGNVIMERFIPASSTIPGFGGTGQDGLGYHLFSSPFSDATVSQFGDDMGLVLTTAYNTAPEPAFVRPFPTFFQYEETNNGATTSAYYNPFISNYKVPTTPNLTVARGYQANIATGVTVDLNGTLNNGNQSIAVTNSGGAGYNLIGNPYPSPISWTALHGFGTNNTFLNSEVQLDIPIGQYEGSFASYTAAGVSNNGGKNEIASMQGFFVRATGNGTVTMDNTVRLGTDARFFKTTDLENAKEGLVRVALRKDGIMDETTVYFQEGATPAYDASFDAGKLHKINSKYSTLYSYNENVEAGKEEYFSINGLGSFDTEQKLPLAMNIVTDGEYEITLRDMKYFHSKHDVYLYDSLTDSLHNLRVEGDYKFVSTKGTEIKRFVLLFKTDANADFFENERVMVYPNPTPNEFSYSLKTAREGNYTIRLFDATGRIILEENKIKEGAFLEGTINLEKHASGLYLLQVSDAEKTTTVRVVKE